MSNPDSTEDRGYFSTGQWLRDPEPPRARITHDGMVSIQPFGFAGPDLTFNVTVDRWRELAAAVDTAIAAAATAEATAGTA